MAAHDDELTASLIAGLRRGEPGAIYGLWDRYFPKLLRQARSDLARFPRRSFDEEDVALSVFDTLQRGARAGRFENLKNRSNLWALLVALTRQKVVDRMRREGRKKRGGGRVRGDSVFAVRTEQGNGLDGIAGDEPAPEFFICLDDEYRRLTALLRDDGVRRVASLRLEGFSNEEIAEQIGISLRAVQRKVRLIEDRWTQELQR
jgi:DNA-directed RNA polymerase specialized sigma24 family protein